MSETYKELVNRINSAKYNLSNQKAKRHYARAGSSNAIPIPELRASVWKESDKLVKEKYIGMAMQSVFAIALISTGRYIYSQAEIIENSRFWYDNYQSMGTAFVLGAVMPIFRLTKEFYDSLRIPYFANQYIDTNIEVH